MIAENKAEQTPPKRSASQLGRDQIARVVVVASFLTVFLLVSTLVALAKFDAGPEANDVAEKAFNAILPVLAGWVGTVLAFYFSSASQEHTSEILDRAMARAAGRPGDGTLVVETMIPTMKIRGLINLNKDKPSTVTLASLYERFQQTGTPPTTRLMFLEGDVFRYVMHASALNGYLIKAGLGAEALKKPPQPMLDKMLDAPDVVAQIANLVVFVSVKSTLADAKVALDKVNGAQDIIVTATGNSGESVLGWLTNVDLTKALTVT